MELTLNQQKIRNTIRSVCQEEPFATAADIADELSLSKQTVLNNIDAVVAHDPDISTRQVGQANLYYVDRNPINDIRTDETEAIVRIFTTSGPATYAELRHANESSEFDYVVHWYDHEPSELESYVPSDTEIGQAASMEATRPVAIKYYDESDVEGAVVHG